MVSVTRRITEYNKEVGQPRGGLIPPKLFSVEQLGDGAGVLDGKLENLTGGTVGTAVDYLTRLGRLQLEGDAEAKITALLDIFGVSIAGAMRISERTAYASVSADARAALSTLEVIEHDDDTVSFAVDETTVMVACQMATYDVGLRAGPQFYDPSASLRVPDSVTTGHILTMVERARKYFDLHGPLLSDGFVFADRENIMLGERGGYTDLVTSGDGDFLTEATLWDFKTSGTKPTKDHTLQVLMYFLMGKESGLPEFVSLTHIGIFNPRLGTVHRMAVADVPAVVIEIVRRDVIGYDS